MFAAIKNRLNKNNATKAEAKAYQCHLKFRVVFVSPFFELEVDAGNGWQTVHSQEGEKVGNDSSVIYPLLRFKSFDDAVTYATDTLGLTQMKPRSCFGLYMAPPASFGREVQPRLMRPQYIIDGKPVKPSQVQEPAQQVPAFTVFPGGSTDEKKAA